MAPFELQERLVSFGHDGRATDVAIADLSRRRHEWLMGVVDTVDDRSVDAAFWEMHPDDDEILYVLEGRVAVTLVREEAPATTVALAAGQAFIVPRAVWHRLQVLAPGRLLFMTPMAGTEHRRVD